MTNIPPQLETAYKLFLEEFSTHLDFIAKKHSELLPLLHNLSNEECEKIRKSFHHRFHTIKGSSSFFKLEEIRSVAAEGEKLFNDAMSKEAFELAMQELSEVITKLKKCGSG